MKDKRLIDDDGRKSAHFSTNIVMQPELSTNSDDGVLASFSIAVVSVRWVVVMVCGTICGGEMTYRTGGHLSAITMLLT